MKHIFLTLLTVLCMASMAHADRVILNNAETLAVPVSPKLDWYVSKIDAATKTLQISYQWLDSENRPIRKTFRGETWFVWTCQDRAAELVANCTSPGVPYDCCTGPGAGTGCDPGSTCFSDIFRYKIRCPADGGMELGIGTRILIWNKFKTDILTSGNNGTFDTN